MSKLLSKVLLLVLLTPLALFSFTIEGEDGWKYEISKGFMKKHISSNIKDKTAKTKFIKRWKKGHQDGKKSTIVLKKDFVKAVEKMEVVAKTKLRWITVAGKTVYTEEDDGKVIYKCEDVKKIQIQQKVKDKDKKIMSLYHVEKAKASRTRTCKK